MNESQIQPFLFSILVYLFFKPVISSSSLSPEDAQRHYKMLRNDWKIGARGVQRSPSRNLPDTVHTNPSDLECDSYSSVAAEGSVSFTFNSPDKECGHAFIGSKEQHCTVAVICKGWTTIEPADCNGGYITFLDGSIGMMKACGNFSFHDVPRFARNGGTDMYIKYKGKTNDGSVCTAFCKEDLTEAHHKETKLKEPKRLKKNVLYTKPVRDNGCTCGKKSEQAGRIVGGIDITPFEFPWLAAVVFRVEGMERQTLCGATLVSNRYVLTAGHCFHINNDILEAEHTQVVLHTHIMDFIPQQGDNGTESKYHNVPGYDLPKTTDEDEHSLRLNVSKTTIHPLFNMNSLDYDIAILELADPVDIHDNRFTPLCLPEIGKLVDYPTDALFTVAGWGFDHEEAAASSRIPRKVDLPLGSCVVEWNVSPRHMCVGYLSEEKDACRGDSGGPLMYKFKPDANQYMLSGIVSGGHGCAEEGVLGFYTNVQELIQWIYFKMDAPDNKFCSF